MLLLVRFLPLLLALGVFLAKVKARDVLGVLGSSILLDPELKVDPNKNEITWTFISRSILHHVPGHPTMEPSIWFKSRLQYNISSGTLMVNRLKHGDQGGYTFAIDGKVWRIIQLLVFDNLTEASILPNTKSLGFTVQLTCEVSGDHIEYQWQKDGGEVSHHHWLMDGNRTLVIPSASIDDCGMYTCVATNPVSSIQANYTLILQGLSLKEVVLVAASTAGLVLSSASLHPAMFPDQWRWKTLGALLKIKFYFLSLSFSNTVFFIVIYITFAYWILFKGLSPLDVVVIISLITGLRLSSAFVNQPHNTSSDKESQRTGLFVKLLSICKAVLFNCIILTFAVNTVMTGLCSNIIISINH
ncbi:CD48 antigen-like [Leucoraja erinacea]|uniref:CD48 antigen-like n=1 Tax=Leucoraja erinaceus TaxID=7782 RepID=UPI00245379D4|nr:CD48 antigen-like [Leucoraja erinacea]